MLQHINRIAGLCLIRVNTADMGLALKVSSIADEIMALGGIQKLSLNKGGIDVRLDTTNVVAGIELDALYADYIDKIDVICSRASGNSKLIVAAMTRMKEAEAKREGYYSQLEGLTVGDYVRVHNDRMIAVDLRVLMVSDRNRGIVDDLFVARRMKTIQAMNAVIHVTLSGNTVWVETKPFSKTTEVVKQIDNIITHAVAVLMKDKVRLRA